MEIDIKTFKNPFSFFVQCTNASNNNIYDSNPLSEINLSTTSYSDINILHGKYIAAKWRNNWERAIFDTEENLSVWMVDHGVYVHTNEITSFADLPPKYKKTSTKVFEASIHGVVPYSKHLSMLCTIENVASTTWSKGSVVQAKKLINDAQHIYFVPLALMSSSHNDVVLGDLYLDIPEKGVVNLVHELEQWPVFLEKNNKEYWSNIRMYYNRKRKHHACTSKPNISEMPLLTLDTPYKTYEKIHQNALLPDIKSRPKDSKKKYEYDVYKRLSPKGIEKFSNATVIIDGRECNALELITNKLKEMEYFDKYLEYPVEYDIVDD